MIQRDFGRVRRRARDWGADRRALSIHARDAATSRHSPTVFNSMVQPALRWLGDRKTGADQAESSPVGSMGFASKEAGIEVPRKLDYLPAFRQAYPQDAEPLTPRNYSRALAAYQAILTTPAPFDRFLAETTPRSTIGRSAACALSSVPAVRAATVERCSAAR